MIHVYTLIHLSPHIIVETNKYIVFIIFLNMGYKGIHVAVRVSSSPVGGSDCYYVSLSPQ